MVEKDTTTEYSPGPAKRKHDAVETNKGDEGVSSSTQDGTAKRPKTLGPAMPPPGIIPQASDSSDDSDDDDEYGPALPPPKTNASDDKDSKRPPDPATATTTTTTPPAATGGSGTNSAVDTSKRDDWMLRPPDELDLSSRVDPTKLRNRKFNAQPSRPNPSTGPSKMWTETPDEKRKRLENEVMGIQAPASTGDKPKDQPSDSAEAKSKQIRDYNEKKRNKSLYKQHQGKSEDLEKDDPSARAFDKEKDIRAPSKVTNSQRREMMNKASDFGSRFSGGSFL